MAEELQDTVNVTNSSSINKVIKKRGREETEDDEPTSPASGSANTNLDESKKQEEAKARKDLETFLITKGIEPSHAEAFEIQLKHIRKSRPNNTSRKSDVSGFSVVGSLHNIFLITTKCCHLV